MECIFCRIIAGEVPSNVIYQDEQSIAIRDINPQAPKHLLIMPKSHIPSLAELKPEQEALIGHLITLANRLAKEEGVSEKGYRIVINAGPDSGQEVPHLHIHLLGGRALGRLG